MSAVVFRRTIGGAMVSARYTVVDWVRSDNPALAAYLEVGGHRITYSMQTRGLAQDNPNNKGAHLTLMLRGYNSMHTGVPGSDGAAPPRNTEGYESLSCSDFEYAVPMLDIHHPDGLGKEVEIDGETVLEVRVYP